jgi:hypothetical protein
LLLRKKIIGPINFKTGHPDPVLTQEWGKKPDMLAPKRFPSQTFPAYFSWQASAKNATE